MTLNMFGLVAVWLSFASPAFAQLDSWHNAHPIAWMYAPPVGEPPGWSASTWFNLEVGQANVWNMQSTYTDKRNGNIYTYKADFEQTNAIIDTGFALNDSVAFSLEIPYANRNGGFMDDFIDQFHVFIHSDRFQRNYNDKYGNDFQIQTNGQSTIGSSHGEGVANIKPKVKLWLLHWRSPTPGVCDCGLAVSGQVKIPTRDRATGLTSGKVDTYGLVHLGAPLGEQSAVWATASFGKLGYNDDFAGWPQRVWQQMYELNLDLGADANWGLMLAARLESPLFEQRYLAYNYSYSDPTSKAAERIASGWNALVDWRGSEIIGIRYRWGQGSRINFIMQEDWGLGDQDHIGTWNYVNDAPDVTFLTQWHFQF